MNLTEESISFILISAHKADRSSDDNKLRSGKLESILYAKEYNLEHIRGYYQGSWEDTYLAFTDIESSELKKDAIFLITQFDIDDVIIKYKSEPIIRRIYKDGKEKPLSLNAYDGEMQDRAYVIKDLSISFLEKKQYKMVSNKSEIKVGMTVEIFNNNKWIERSIENIDKEWSSIYNLFAKHNKLRFSLP